MADWNAALLGKKIVEGSGDGASTFAKSELPPGTRVLGPETKKTADHRPERLNVHVDKDGICFRTKFG